jgi:DNA-binding NarL/FixJ family response regulator
MAPAGTDALRVLIVDDSELFAAGLHAVITDEPDMHVVGVAASGAAAVRDVVALEPDLILLDQRLPDVQGVDLIGPLLDARPAAQIVMLTASTSGQVLIAALEAGAAGVIDKSRAAEGLTSGLRAAAAGRSLIAPGALARLLPVPPARPGAPADALTAPELELLELLAAGLSDVSIATRLSATRDAVRGLLRGLYAKLGAGTRMEALAVASASGLVSV